MPQRRGRCSGCDRSIEPQYASDDFHGSDLVSELEAHHPRALKNGLVLHGPGPWLLLPTIYIYAERTEQEGGYDPMQADTINH
jgi:hypothetical protein